MYIFTDAIGCLRATRIIALFVNIVCPSFNRISESCEVHITSPITFSNQSQGLATNGVVYVACSSGGIVAV